MKMFPLLMITCFSLSAFAQVTCKESKSLLYQAGANNDLKVEIISDFNHINNTTIEDYKPYAPGIMNYVSSDGNTVSMAIQVEARGNSRYTNCEWRPLKLVYEGEDYTKSLIEDASKTNMSLYQALAARKGVTETFGPYKKSSDFKLFVGEKNKETIFASTGDSIRLVSHCGDTKWYEDGNQILGGKTKEIQESKVLKEHYLYQILSTINTTTIKTRLATITYKDTEGNELLTRKAFFLEDASRMAKRCGLKKGRGNSKNLQSSFQIDLFNRFIFNNDYYLRENEEHNLMLFHDDNKETHIIGYDYDLTGLISPYYKKNKMYTVDTYRVSIKNWLEKFNFGPLEIPTIENLLSHKDDMFKIVEESFLGEEDKALMNYWLDSYTKTLRTYVEQR